MIDHAMREVEPGTPGQPLARSPVVSRRSFIAAFSVALVSARHALVAADAKPAGTIGICTFSCHRAWQALRDRSAPVPFADAPGFYDYARGLGADGVQTSMATLPDAAAATRLREHVQQTGGYYEGDVRLPKDAGDLDAFEREVKLTRAAGADVARTFLSGSRRYETWRTLAEFKAFRDGAHKRLALVEPIVKKHRLRLAVENHKDLTSDELVALMRRIDSEWIGVNVDTGNNIALLEDPYDAVGALAPFARSVHLKDMAVQPHESGFLLSEVVCGEGFLDLARIVAVLRKANPQLRLNLEMATRDPLLVPCLTEGYFATFPERKATHLDAAMRLVSRNPPRRPPPSLTGKSMPRQLADEETNNRESLRWMHRHLAE
jgi:sugar phosphate isomerase/epimerase